MSSEPLGLSASLRLMRAHHARPDWVNYDPLDALIAVCVDTVPAAEAAAISHCGGGRVRSTHYTDPAITDIDHRQCDFGRGPLLTAALAQPAFRSVATVDDLVLDVVFDGTTVEVVPPFRSLHTTTVRSEGGHRTALDLYAREPHAFADDTTVLADMFAIRAAQLLYGPDDTDAGGRRRAAETVSRRLGVPPDEAEQLLEARLLDAPRRDPSGIAQPATRRDGAPDGPEH